jgi:hypothetical protein
MLKKGGVLFHVWSGASWRSFYLLRIEAINHTQRVIDRGFDVLPISGAIDKINQFPVWAKGEAQALPA